MDYAVGDKFNNQWPSDSSREFELVAISERGNLGPAYWLKVDNSLFTTYDLSTYRKIELKFEVGKNYSYPSSDRVYHCTAIEDDHCLLWWKSSKGSILQSIWKRQSDRVTFEEVE